MQAKKEKHGILDDDKAFNNSRIKRLEEILTDKVIHPQLRTQHTFYFIKVTSSYNLSVTDAALLTQITYSCAQPFSALKYFYLIPYLLLPSKKACYSSLYLQRIRRMDYSFSSCHLFCIRRWLLHVLSAFFFLD